MKKNYYLLLAGILVLGMSSCNTDKTKDTAGALETGLVEDAASATDKDSKLVLNPEHGLPGHRCDIPVGKALPAGSVIPSSTPPKVQLQSPLLINELKLNPKHGQPGHRCDIPVGQALPATKATPSNR